MLGKCFKVNDALLTVLAAEAQHGAPGVQHGAPDVALLSLDEPRPLDAPVAAPPSTTTVAAPPSTTTVDLLDFDFGPSAFLRAHPRLGPPPPPPVALSATLPVTPPPPPVALAVTPTLATPTLATPTLVAHPTLPSPDDDDDGNVLL